MTLKELREKRQDVAEQIKKLAKVVEKEGRKLSDDERAKWNELDAEFVDLSHQIAILERAEKIEGEQAERKTAPVSDFNGRKTAESGERSGGKPEVTEEHRSLALQAWFRRQSSEGLEINDEHREACQLVGLNPNAKVLSVSLPHAHRFEKMRRDGWGGGYGSSYSGAERRALSAVTGSAGAFTVPTSMVNQLEVSMLAFGGMMQAAEVIRTEGGEPLTWPTANDTSNSGRQIGESAAVTATDPTFGSVTWGAYKFSSDEIKVPTELLQDSAFDLAGVLGNMLGERLGRILNTKFTTGTGAATPYGLVTAANTGKTTSSSTAITWDEVTDLIHSVDPAYRNGAAFMFSDGIYQLLRKLKDGEGRPLWADGPNSTPPATLQGYPYFINQDMASSATASAKTMVFGQLNKYKIRQVRDIRFYRLVERHRENDQDAFLAFIRADGNLLDAGTDPVKAMVQA